MPVCTTCAHRADYLYTTYRTKSNIRLGVCPRCSAFLDPLIEHPPLLLILDLILLKPRVFLHLLYNRGTLPLDATVTQPSTAGSPEVDEREAILWEDLIRLAGVTLAAETLVRLGSARWGSGGDLGMGRLVGVMGVVMVEMAAQYSTTLALALGVLRIRGWWPVASNGRETPGGPWVDGRRENFRPILIPLTLLYTSVLPLLLHLILSIWYHPPQLDTISHTHHHFTTFAVHLPPQLANTIDALVQAWNTTDRIWAGTRLLGGMSAGFGLRVVLPTRPWETTGIVLAGWAAAAAVGWLVDSGPAHV